MQIVYKVEEQHFQLNIKNRAHAAARDQALV